jgi:O-antigen ligase
MDRLKLSYLFYITAWTLFCSLLLGGGVANVYLTNALLQLLALPGLIAALWRLSVVGPTPAARPVLYLIAAAILLVMLQLAPVPPGLWSALPFRDRAVAAFSAIGEAKKWAPLSLTPEATLVGLATLIAPLSLFLSVISLSFRERRMLTLIALAFGFINAFLGLLQLSQGPESALYFYKYGGRGDSVGLFANRNHEAALLYSLTPLAAAWIGGLAPAVSIRSRRGKLDTTALIKLLTAGVTAFVLVVAALMTRSRAGVILLMLALLGGLSLQPWRQLRTGSSRAGGVYMIVAILAMMLGLQYGIYKIAMRFEEDPFGDARIAIGQATAKAAVQALPFGTGLGSFVRLYASIERPSDLLPDRFINLAHNDPLQFALEAGLPGIALILGFLLWFISRLRPIWRSSEAGLDEGGPGARGAVPPDASVIDTLIARAATISLALLALHSFVDYPLRTTALMGLFAFFCALLVGPPEAAGHLSSTNVPTHASGARRERGPSHTSKQAR